MIGRLAASQSGVRSRWWWMAVALLVAAPLGILAGCGGRSETTDHDRVGTGGNTGQVSSATNDRHDHDAGDEHSEHEVDNTGVNRRDSTDATLTPLDQGETEADRAITQEVRRLVTSHDTFSVNAKNVKIITRDGVVTLRGPVDSSSEKDAIEAAARTVAGVSSVTNELEVKGEGKL